MIISHEHDDHFDLPSLAQIDRRVPVYLSSRSSVAARDCLRQLGFSVSALTPHSLLCVGDLEFRTLVGDLRAIESCDEWDVFPLAVRERGRLELSATVRRELAMVLQEFAAYLYGTPVFRQLHSLGERTGNWQTGICLQLLTADAELCFVYDARGCSFVEQAVIEPVASYSSGLRCWASDLHAFLMGELPTTAMCYAGYLQSWNHAPEWLRISPHTLWMFGHPMRRPDASARLYARMLAEIESQSETTIQIAARGV